MIEKVAEAIRKFKAVIDTEHNAKKKQVMTEILNSMQSQYDAIVKENIPCPSSMAEEVGQSLKLIDELYNKTASN